MIHDDQDDQGGASMAEGLEPRQRLSLGEVMLSVLCTRAASSSPRRPMARGASKACCSKPHLLIHPVCFVRSCACMCMVAGMFVAVGRMSLMAIMTPSLRSPWSLIVPVTLASLV